MSIKIRNLKEIISVISKDLTFSNDFNWSPKKTRIKIKGEKPIKDDKINFNFEIFKKDKIKFCTIKGVPGIILKIIKNSIDELDIYLSICLEYFLIVLGENLLRKYDEKIKNNKLPKTIVKMDIIKPI